MSPKTCTKVNGYQLLLVIQQLTKDLEFTEVKRLVTACPGEADHLSVHDTVEHVTDTLPLDMDVTVAHC